MHARALLGSAFVAALLAFAVTPSTDDGSWGVRDARAHSYVEVSVDFLAQRAQRVVVATPQDQMSTWEDAEGGRRIVTYHRVRVDSDVTGSGDPEVWVRTLGGVVDKIGQRVHGVAPLRTGQPFLLFLTQRTDGTFSVVSMEQGCFPVTVKKDKSIVVDRRRLVHAALPSKPGLRPSSSLEGKPLDEVRRIIVEAKKRHAK